MDRRGAGCPVGEPLREPKLDRIKPQLGKPIMLKAVDGDHAFIPDRVLKTFIAGVAVRYLGGRHVGVRVNPRVLADPRPVVGPDRRSQIVKEEVA